MVNPASRVVFRVDAGVKIGSGHVMRCLALAAALRELGSESHFVCRSHPGHLKDLIESQGHRVHLLPYTQGAARSGLGAEAAVDAAQTGQAIEGLRPDWLVVDHYDIDAAWEESVRAAVPRLLAIDDLANRDHRVDVLVDPNLQPQSGRYDDRVGGATQRLLGPRYALLRPEFAAQRAAGGARDGRLRKLLASAGGIDQTGLLPKVVRAWAAMPKGARPSLALVVGRATPNLTELSALCQAHPDCSLHVQTDRVAELMADADLLIAAGGGMNWERCCLGLPGVLCETADNQADNIAGLVRARTAVSLGPSGALQPASLQRCLEGLAVRAGLLRRMEQRAARLVDGQGNYRVAVAMGASKLALRRATIDDAEFAWQWRNAESTRRHSTDPSVIALAGHLAWWRASLSDGQRSLWIAEVGTAAVGVLRADHDGADATLSIYLDPRLTGLGLGTLVLRAGQRWLQTHRPQTHRLHALIHADNRASTRAFAAAGFAPRDGRWMCELSTPAESRAIHP
jgi:UDP-2,4-diacetamido-2,4,6-trideoxy-beta-L-altropyranose hydrolase